jgi:hypothetical protein
MAAIYLGNIVINDGTGYTTYSTGDTLYMYWNDVTKEVEVHQTGAGIITDGDDFLQGATSWYWAEQTSPEVIDGGNIITFQYYTYFPYVQWITDSSPPETVAETAGEVNDLEISINLITPATGEITADGSFIVTASGTNTPFLYSLTNFVGDGGQSSSTFSDLVPGTYTVTAKDSLGYKSEGVDVLVGYDSEAHAIRWWYKEQNKAGVIFLVDILERGYTGGSTEVTGKNPFVLSLRGEGGDIHSQGIIASSASISLVSTIVDQYKDISLGDDYKYKINRYINTSTLQWSGYVLPRTYQKEIKSLNYTTSFTATDGLGDLKSLDFHTEQDWDLGYKTSIRGRISQLDAFRICLSKLKLDQGFRIACNIFDATHTTSNNSPINQTQINSNVYTDYDVKTRIIAGDLRSIEEPSYSTCEQVLKDILTIYKAILVNWEGYWYIIDQEELLNTTINYVEYNSVGAYVSTGSLTPQISFNTAQSTSRWRWMGTQTANTTDVYRNLILKVNLHLSEGGILKGFVLKTFNTINVITDIVRTQGIGGRQLRGGSGLPIDRTVYQNITEQTALNYLLFNDNIEYSGDDSLSLKVESITSLTYGRRSVSEIPEATAPPYLNLRWMLKVNNKYSSPYKKTGNLRTGISDINWSTDETINDHYITEFGVKDLLEIKVPFDNVEKTTSTYDLRVYIPNLYDYDYEGTNEANMILAVKGVDVSTFKGGHRIIARYLAGAIHFYFYYELQLISGSQDDLNVVIPTTGGGGGIRWRLIHSREYPILEGDSMTETTFTELSLTQNPEGFDAPEEVELTSTLNDKNKIDIERDVNIFDEYQIINNAENIYDNHTTYTDGTPTSAWTKVGATISKTLQEHLLLWDTQLLKQPRQRVNGNFTSDVQVTPLSTLKDSGTSNKIYYIQGLTLNDYRQEYSGEIIEIGSDDTPVISAFTTGFKQNAVE